MIGRIAASLAALATLLVCTAAAAEPAARFLAPTAGAFEVIALDPPAEKIDAPIVEASGRLRVATVRSLAKAVRLQSWAPLAGGYLTRVRSVSPEAHGLRVKLELGAMPGPMEVRVQGSGGRIETMTLDPLNGPEAWTPWTEGEWQDIEIFSRVPPAADAVQVGGVLHFATSPLAKSTAASCTLSTACGSGDPALDAAIAERKKSVFKIQYMADGKGYVCTATLVDTPRRPAAFALTANHCIDHAAAASSITSFWFYEAGTCGGTTMNPAMVQDGGGAQLTFTNYNLDMTLMLMNTAPPAAAVFAPMNQALLGSGEAVVSISHPRGDTSRWAMGTAGSQLRDANRPYNMYSANYSRGIIEPGSSGSGLFTMSGGRLHLRGVLSQGALDLSCANPTLFTLYGRLEAFYPQMAQYIGATSAPADDAPNRPQELAGLAQDPNGTDALPLDQRTATLNLENRRIEYPGDVDVYRFTVASPSYVSVWTDGAMDTVGTLLRADGAPVAEEGVANDDADWSSSSNTNFGITYKLDPGTYFVHVANWTPTGTGTYHLRMRADGVDNNYTDLWWNPAEPGWGINLNHQGDILFATLFTYDASHAPIWLVMSAGRRQADGAYEGTLYQTAGPAFNAVPFRGTTTNAVGTMRLVFSGADAATLTYTFNGATVTKSITRQAFSTPPTCSWSAFDRASADNYQDLWWNPSEPGWGLNVAHQGLKMFATLFTYGTDGRPLWLVMSDGNLNFSGAYTGALYRTSGPAFNTVPWSPASATQVGTMTLTFNHGNSATLTYSVNGASVTKQIERQTFGGIKTRCET